jgi:beta-glucosidase
VDSSLFRAVAALPLERKVELLSGTDLWHTSHLRELGYEPLRVTDGPNGARGHVFGGEPSTCFPVGTALAATWNPALITEVGRALAVETRAKGAGLLLAPTVNMHRHPLAGRNFEAYSEDPYLTAEIAVAYIRGVQSLGVGACIKHFVGNESEYERHTMSSDIDERTLREVYFAPFERAVRDAGVWAVMASYNRLNGIAASDHRWLLTEVLREQWGFNGAVISDWHGTRSTAAAVQAGVDLEMPGPTERRGAKLLNALASGEVEMADLDRAATAVAGLIARTDNDEYLAADAPSVGEIAAIALEAARQSMVLCTNDGLLPLRSEREENAGDTSPRIAVIGPNAGRGQIQGGGSSRVTPAAQVGPLEGLRARFGAAHVTYAPGCVIDRFCPGLDARRVTTPAGVPGVLMEVFDGRQWAGDPVRVDTVRSLSQVFYGEIPDVADDQSFSVRLSAKFVPEVSGTHVLGVACSGTVRVLLDGAGVLTVSSRDLTGDTFYGYGTDEVCTEVDLVAGREVEFCAEFVRDTPSAIVGTIIGLRTPETQDLFATAVAAAAQAEVAVVVVGLDGQWETEGNDRVDLTLPGRQDELVSAVAAANPRTVVVVNAGSPVAMPWRSEVAAIIQAWYPGQSFGTALAEIIAGDVCPSGKLPCTFPLDLADTPAVGHYPGTDGHVSYDEGIFLGYRHYDRDGLEVMFSFGHGLSYTSFEYGEPEVMPEGDGLQITVPITNIGDCEGAEVVQAYLHFPETQVVRPERTLGSFTKVVAQPGETVQAVLVIEQSVLRVWDSGEWLIEPGPVVVEIGSSSRDLRCKVTLSGFGALSTPIMRVSEPNM